MSIGNNIRNYRTIKGWTLKELGEKSNLAITSLSDYELGKSSPSIKALRRIASALEVGIEYLLKEVK